MDNPWLPRYALLVAVSAFILVITGALSAQGTQAFRFGLAVIGVLSLILTAAARGARPTAMLSGLLFVEGGLSLFVSAYPIAAGIAHSCVLCAILCLAASIALLYSESWKHTSVLLDDGASPSLRSLALFAGFSLAAQVAIGAAFRREAISIIPHIVGAMLVAAIILYLVTAVFMQCSAHPEIRKPAILLTGLVGTQVLLGIGAFLDKVGSPLLAMPPKVFSAAHIVTGSLTMATTVILAMRIHRHIRIVETGLVVNS